MQGSLQPASNSSPQFLLLRVIITLQADHDTRDTIIHLCDDWEHEAGNCSNFIILDILSWLHWSLVTMLQFSAMIRMSSCSDLHKHMIISVRLCSYKLPTIKTNPETHVTEDHQPDDNLYNCTQYQLSLACSTLWSDLQERRHHKCRHEYMIISAAMLLFSSQLCPQCSQGEASLHYPCPIQGWELSAGVRRSHYKDILYSTIRLACL